MTKSFLGNTVLADVDVALVPGEVHGLVGENGAGKSTLMKLLAGVYAPDSGVIELDGREISFGHPVQAQRAGVSTVFQEFNLLPERTIAENVYLGREPRRFGLVDTRGMSRDTAELLDGLGVGYLKPGTLVRQLSVAEQQVVEIAKAVSFDAKVIQMDEPTAALADHEVELLYSIIERLKARGVAILYVSHRLKEIFDLCQTITILKDGRQVSTGPASGLTEASLVRQMVGRPLTSYFPDKIPGTEVGEVRAHADRAPATRTSTGSTSRSAPGRSSAWPGSRARAAPSSSRRCSACTRSTAAPWRSTARPSACAARARASAAGSRWSPRTARPRASRSTSRSSTTPSASSARCCPPAPAPRAASCPGVLSSLEVSARGLDQEVQFLSGGNQQKVVLARWLSIAPRVVLMDEPTRGIDVGAKHAVYELMRKLAADGVAVLMVSSELPEVIGMSDRILVMRDGLLVGELPAGSTEEQVLALATGAATEDGAA